jgi:hypothetical protein
MFPVEVLSAASRTIHFAFFTLHLNMVAMM